MYHRSLAQTPIFACPEGFAIQPYKRGRELDWLRIHRDADLYNSFADSMFVEQFGTSEALLIERQFYLVRQGDTAVGTASAWFNKDDRRARVHWVAIETEFHGLGLAKPLLSAVCQKLLALGHADAVLSTSTARVAAINLYLKFGFEPLIITDADQGAWTDFELNSIKPK
jgi:GNAT superfamily N-acetyltransferase